ncbi:flagellar assembly protein FliX [Elioraea rosea]|uniref:flagellar assembly protein FliX n=1 Tax=Elioraea rosea TaxID=2492390 RepID=UPI0013157430|nr:flagellar assembly protein FliX [Elioraea rosea]
MVKITGYGPIAPPARLGRATGAQGRFRVPADGLAGAASEAREAASAEGVTIAASLIALQETIAGGERDREARQRAESMLDELAGLQRAMLGGRISPERLAALAQLADEPGVAADPRLADVVAAVSLRAKVELARLEVARARREAIPA